MRSKKVDALPVCNVRTRHGSQGLAEEAVVKAGHQPPAGRGLDDGVPKGPTATIRTEPLQGLLNAPVLVSTTPSLSGERSPMPKVGPLQ